MIEQLPVLLIVTPILAATLSLLLGVRYGRAGWSIAALTTTALFGLAVWLATSVFSGGTIVYEVGNFPRPIGIELVADRLSALVVVLVAGVSAGVLAYTRRGGPRGTSFYSAYLLLVGGLLGLSLTGDVFNMFVFLEITGLTTYALIAKGESGESAVAALKYLIIGTVGASLYLIGVGFLFLATGTLNMVDLAASIPAAEGGYANPLVLAAFAFVFVGFAIKIALFPLHTWQPDAYQRAPDGVTALISALVSTVSAYALFRVIYSVFTIEFLVATPHVTEVIVAFGSVSVLAGTALAVIQTEIKRTLAYSSVSQFGLVVLAYGLANETALLGGLVHLLGHAIMKGGLFLAFGVVAAKTGARTVDEYAGLARRAPFAAGTFAVLGLALVGVPPSIGFVGKWYIAVGAVEAGIWPVAVVVFLSTMLTLAYVARLIEKMYFTPPTGDVHAAERAVAADGGAENDAEATTRNPVSAGMLGAAVFAALLVVALGFSGSVFDSLLGPFVKVVLNG
ncbi:monovalent cation/H+ antiporter subunit D family protein [Halalkalicoccus jeotgali]|uniref:NADH/Ubiquinone/plastoquinone (Complex I) n=1 Tax=Halalkalicoccus jeotgali (strain DSM 18796 / CECT 7217 / JCM 14584 / KCTC 4019 / B3) TaxID=795797 RepID=D8J659_HALJB|nr:monovalent cation/H+ antiporter subunit D family protein [Halalkalicoccus jeotgali]ADJ15777.1 NADH/Ubiquinone/plastoquinone (complex I) [Halalkalicoccus jeotgali B3]ELY37199.1 NADH/Ubiquinone/plastoquinone (complex I) [Halalkalicoccus jeotgali B3]